MGGNEGEYLCLTFSILKTTTDTQALPSIMSACMSPGKSSLRTMASTLPCRNTTSFHSWYHCQFLPGIGQLRWAYLLRISATLISELFSVEGYLFFPLTIPHPPVHSRRIKAEIKVTFRIHRYQSAFTAHSHKLILHHYITGFLQR